MQTSVVQISFTSTKMNTSGVVMSFWIEMREYSVNKFSHLFSHCYDDLRYHHQKLLYSYTAVSELCEEKKKSRNVKITPNSQKKSFQNCTLYYLALNSSCADIVYVSRHGSEW